MAPASVDHIIAIPTTYVIIASPQSDLIVTITAFSGVVPDRIRYPIVAFAAIQPILTGSAVDDVVAGATTEHIIAAVAEQRVVPIKRINNVLTPAAVERIVPVRGSIDLLARSIRPRARQQNPRLECVRPKFPPATTASILRIPGHARVNILCTTATQQPTKNAALLRHHDAPNLETKEPPVR
jgi:hypothetical protein